MFSFQSFTEPRGFFQNGAGAEQDGGWPDSIPTMPLLAQLQYDQRS